jgi:acyl-CoA reductase-like NAD-dependent aldehyde dehydrogenase
VSDSALQILIILTMYCHYTIIRSWMKPTYTPVSAVCAPAVSEIVHEPFGVVLVIGPFNYPIQLMVGIYIYIAYIHTINTTITLAYCI